MAISSTRGSNVSRIRDGGWTVRESCVSSFTLVDTELTRRT